MIAWQKFIRCGVVIALIGLFFTAVILAIGLGTVIIKPHEVMTSLWRGINGHVVSGDDIIIWQVRLPRVVMSIIVGASLSVCGGAFQGVFRNPLADPYLLGVASGAALGSTLAITASLPRASVPLLSFAGALVAVSITLLLARKGRRFPPTRLILAGVVVGSILSSISTFLLLRGEDHAREVLAYTLGDLSLSSWSDVVSVIPYAVFGCTLLILLGRALDTLQLGDITARSLGVPVERLRILIVIVASLATAAAVAYVGIIGFVGLIVPHIVRLISAGNYRLLLALSALTGGTLLVLADLLARTTPLMQVGVVTTLLGGPFFLWLLYRGKYE